MELCTAAEVEWSLIRLRMRAWSVENLPEPAVKPKSAITGVKGGLD
jgi:hypothetical protein